MVVVSYSGKEINAKLVYYGAGLSGKTTNLEAIYEAVPDTSRGKMVSMKTQSDRTLFFDLLPLDLGEIMGFKTRFLLYTVPGQVFYNATRKLVLKGADAIVFVADSEVGKMEENKESLANLRANLAEYNINLDSIPWVIQYNKRDLPNVYTLDELNAELNQGGKVPFFEACAREGKGVFETFRGISHLLMEKVTKDLRRSPASSTPAPKPVAEAEPPAAQRPAMHAPPSAPGQAIRTEAHASPPGLPDNPARIDYGREIELPGMVASTQASASTPTPPALTPSTTSPPAPPSREPAFAATPNRPVTDGPMSQSMLRPASGVMPSPLPMGQPVAAAPAPRPVAPVGAQRIEATAKVEAGQGQPAVIQVPIKLQNGATVEVVIRLQIQAE